MTLPKSIAVLGATGSIGTSTLEVVRQCPQRFQVTSLTCRNSVEYMAELIREFRPQRVCVGSSDQARHLREAFPQLEVHWDTKGLIRIAEDPETELVVAGIVGAAGLAPTFAAVSAGKIIAFANKEPLVLAGRLFVEKAVETGAKILPADSEHNAIFQILNGRAPENVSRLILTASGGPFRDLPLEQFKDVCLADALNHPNWNMGKKITIDSATMMNKGLEVIEARWLFGIPLTKISVLVHHESIIHSLVEFTDGSSLAQMGLPDMRIPISYCLGWPERLELELPLLDLAELGSLHFEKADSQRFPCLSLAYETAVAEGGAPAVLNGANEAVVAEYLKGEMSFIDISQTLEAVMIDFRTLLNKQDAPRFLRKINTLEDAIQADDWGRRQVHRRLEHAAAA